jgi:hypothetical protein
VVAAAALIGAAAAGAGSSATCQPKFEGGVEYLCGPATARLSKFPGVVFRHGSCKRERVAGEPQMTIEIGAIKPGSKRNGGRDYIKVTVAGPLSHPTTGYVIAYHSGRRWSGTGSSFHGDAHSGSFTAEAVPPSRGTAVGRYHC